MSILTSTIAKPQIGGSLDVDSYSANNPIIALSFRQISSSYVGSLATFRRASDGATQSFSASGGFGTFIDWSAVTTWAGGAFYLQKWFDQSGQANHGEQLTLSKQPEMVSSHGMTGVTYIPYFNSAHVIPFDSNPGTTFQNVDARSFFMCYQPMSTATDTSGGLAVGVSDSLTGFTQDMWVFSSTNYNRVTWMSNVTLATSTFAINVPHHAHYKKITGGNQEINIDNGAITTSNGAPATFGSRRYMFLGAGHNNLFLPWKGMISELIWLQDNPSSTIVNQIRNEQNSIYTLF